MGLRFGRVIRRIRRGGGARHGFHHVDAQIVVGDGGLEVIQGDAIAPGDFFAGAQVGHLVHRAFRDAHVFVGNADGEGAGGIVDVVVGDHQDALAVHVPGVAGEGFQADDLHLANVGFPMVLREVVEDFRIGAADADDFLDAFIEGAVFGLFQQIQLQRGQKGGGVAVQRVVELFAHEEDGNKGGQQGLVAEVDQAALDRVRLVVAGGVEGVEAGGAGFVQDFLEIGAQAVALLDRFHDVVVFGVHFPVVPGKALAGMLIEIVGGLQALVGVFGEDADLPAGGQGPFPDIQKDAVAGGAGFAVAAQAVKADVRNQIQ